MVIKPTDPTQLQTYTFEIWGEAEGGYLEKTGTMTLIVKCIAENIYIYKPPTWKQEVVYYKGVAAATEPYIFDSFTTSHNYCWVVQYDIDDNQSDSLLIKPTMVNWNTGCAADHLCRSLVIDTDVSRNQTIYLKVWSRQNDPYKYFELNI